MIEAFVIDPRSVSAPLAVALTFLRYARRRRSAIDPLQHIAGSDGLLGSIKGDNQLWFDQNDDSATDVTPKEEI